MHVLGTYQTASLVDNVSTGLDCVKTNQSQQNNLRYQLVGGYCPPLAGAMYQLGAAGQYSGITQDERQPASVAVACRNCPINGTITGLRR